MDENKEVTVTAQETAVPASEQIAALEAEVLKWKTASNKASADAANYKRQLSAKMTADEQAEATKAEREQYVKSLERENAIMKQTSFLVGKGFTNDEAIKISEARYDGDIETALTIENAHYDALESARQKAYEERLAKLQQPASGNGGSTNYAEQMNKALADGNMVEYARLVRVSNGSNS